MELCIWKSQNFVTLVVTLVTTLTLLLYLYLFLFLKRGIVKGEF